MTPAMAVARREAWLWLASRASAAVLALCVVVHLVTMILAVRHGLSAEAILARTRGNLAWAAFYGVFVLAVSIHAPLGVRTVVTEVARSGGRLLDALMIVFACALLVGGLRAVVAVTVLP